LAKEEASKDLKGFHLEKDGGGIIGIIKKLIVLILIILVLTYFFKRDWFNLIIDSVRGFF
jgi:flagellar biogenesis protein FliO